MSDNPENTQTAMWRPGFWKMSAGGVLTFFTWPGIPSSLLIPLIIRDILEGKADIGEIALIPYSLLSFYALFLLCSGGSEYIRDLKKFPSNGSKGV
jgi:hypothetical protein